MLGISHAHKLKTFRTPDFARFVKKRKKDNCTVATSAKNSAKIEFRVIEKGSSILTRMFFISGDLYCVKETFIKKIRFKTCQKDFIALKIIWNLRSSDTSPDLDIWKIVHLYRCF